MKKTFTQSSRNSQKLKPNQFELNQTYREPNTKDNQLVITPKQQKDSKIFVQTPQPVFIPIHHEKSLQIVPAFDSSTSPKQSEQKDRNTTIFNSGLLEQRKSLRQASTLSSIDFHKNEQISSVLKSKTSISFKKERVSEFFYYQNFIVCKAPRKVIVYNLFNKSILKIPVNFDQFILTPFPPYVFNCVTGQFLNLYSEDTIERYAQISRRNQNTLKKSKIFDPNHSHQNNSSKQENETFNQKEIKVVVIKISKLEVQCICRYSQVFYMGGYNRSILPGAKRSERREVYLMEHLDPKINNKPKEVIKIEPSNSSVSMIQAQMPYLIVYCKPTFYIFGLKSHDLLLTFQKQLKSSILLEGRFALNVINGIGISNRNNTSTIFTYDVQSTPIYGVQITEHKQEASSICLQKTGRIFGCHKNSLFQYIPTKRITRCVKMYPESDRILWMESTPNNNLLVLRQTEGLEYLIEAFSIDESSISDF